MPGSPAGALIWDKRPTPGRQGPGARAAWERRYLPMW